MMPVDPGGRSYGDLKDDSSRSGVTAVITATGVSPVFGAADIAAIEATAEASAVSGTTPSLTVTLEGSDDGTNFFPIGAAGFNAITAAKTPQTRTFGVEAWKELRWKYTVSGTTPSLSLVLTTKVKLTGNA